MAEHGDRDLPIEEMRERYRIEREKRMRPEGLGQYAELAGDFEDLDVDTFVEPGFTRDPIVEETQVVIVGGGFAGMLTAINLTKLGMRDFRLVEKAGDFGGTWYWNRYPGCMCDVESYTYLPLLEETGYMPTEKYASAPEIFGYCQLLGRTFDLYPHALFQTVITGAEWDAGTERWIVTTSRGDRLASRFVVVAGGILHKPKLPGIPGIRGFGGRMFHTSHWDYAYTGGSPTEPMDKLADKRVGIVGTGGHRGAGGAAAGPGGQGALRVPAHPERGGRAQQRADRRGVVPEPAAGVAGRADRELHQRGDREAAGAEPRG